jgi:hypothetical protein
LDSGALNLPPPKDGIHYHFIGDDIFPLTTSLMKPFCRKDHMGVKEKIFNYRFVFSVLQLLYCSQTYYILA